MDVLFGALKQHELCELATIKALKQKRTQHIVVECNLSMGSLPICQPNKNRREQEKESLQEQYNEPNLCNKIK